ncbi:MAG: glycosyltransferase family 2 protein [Paracoccaceae bacterium]
MAGTEPNIPAASWGVVATAAEPAPLLVAFAAHHLDRGARRVHLYLDRPNPAFRAMVGADDRIVITDATRGFFRGELGRGRPKTITRRQIALANHALAVTDADWLIHLDADEFLGQGDPAAELAALPAHVLGLHIPNGERVFVDGAPTTSILDGPIALPIRNRRALERLRGAEVARFSATGLLAHALGKSALRARQGPIAGIHWPRTEKAQRAAAQSLRISHFDGVTRLHWALKIRRHIANGVLDVPVYGTGALRHTLLAHVRDHTGSLDEVLALHDRLRLLPRPIARRLRRRGWLSGSGVDAGGAIARQFPGLETDLSPDAFDAQLADLAKPDTVRRSQPRKRAHPADEL